MIYSSLGAQMLIIRFYVKVILVMRPGKTTGWYGNII